MAHKITVPELGESIVEASVLRWLKKEGDEVQAGDIVAELETDKVDVDVAAGAAGILQRIEKQEGADVKIGDVLGEVEESSTGKDNGESAQDKKSKASDEKPGDDSEETESAGETESAEKAGSDGDTEPDGKTGAAGKNDADKKSDRDDSPDDASRITPLAAKLAREHRIDAGGIEGTGAGGKITKGDVERHIESSSGDGGRQRAGDGGEDRGGGDTGESKNEARGEERREERKRMSRRRQTIARRLVEAQQTAAILTTFNEVDMHAVLELRNAQKESFEKRHGVKLGFMSFFVKAAVAALKDFPEINAELRGDEIVYKYYYDVGIAVGAEGGLVVPVLRDADRLSFAGIEKKIRELAAKAEEGTLTVEELRGGTFSITNGGVYGSLLSTPILNPPQTGILGLHKIEERPVVKDGTVVVRPMMYVALSYDHRVVDGRESVQFLVRVKELIERPSAMLLDT